MVYRPTAASQAGVQAGWRRPVVSALRQLPLAALPLLASLAPARADQAQDTLKKMVEIYQNAKSFEGRVTKSQSGKSADGKAASVTIVHKLRFKSPNLFHVEVSGSGTGAAAKQNFQPVTVICDGKNVYQYSPAKKQYVKSAAPPNLTLPQLMMILRMNVFPMGTVTGASMLAPTTAQGRPALVVQVKPDPKKMPPNVPPEAMTPLQFVIDKQNYQLRRLTINGKGGSASVEFAAQTLNGSLGASSFVFTPPAGAKEVKMPAPPPGGAMPGAPGAPGAPAAP